MDGDDSQDGPVASNEQARVGGEQRSLALILVVCCYGVSGGRWRSRTSPLDATLCIWREGSWGVGSFGERADDVYVVHPPSEPTRESAPSP